MNKIYSIFTMLLLSVTALTLGSCTEEYEYSGAKAEGEQVYFSNSLPSTVELSATESSITVPVNRINRQGELTVPLTVSVPDGSSLTVSSQVTFNDGDSVAYVSISYDPTTIEYGHYDEITVAIQDANYTTPYGSSSYTFNAGLTEWRTMSGMATYRDGLVAEQYSHEALTYQVQLQESVLTPGVYRIVNPYGSSTEFYETYGPDGSDDFTFVDDAECYITIDARDPEHVYIANMFDPGCYDEPSGEGHMHFYSFVYYYMVAGGLTLDEVKNQYPGVFGTLEDGVITMPAQALLCQFDNLEGGYYANTEGLFAIALPGYSIRDYSSNFSYTGRFTDANDTDHALGTITLGADVASARYAVAMDGDDLNATVQGIIDGSISSETISASGTVEMNLTDNGIYYMVIVTYDANGEVQDASAYQFIYRLSSVPEDWQVATTGTFIYNAIPNFVSDADNQPVGSWFTGTENATLYQDANFPASYRLEPFGNNSSLPFIMDAYGNISYVDIYTGSNATIQGESYRVYVGDAGIVFDEGSTYSFYDYNGEATDMPGTFVFGNVYYYSLGYLGGAYEFFVPSSATFKLAPQTPTKPFKVATQSNAKSIKTSNGLKLVKKNILRKSANIRQRVK